jgi:hypothetical protein
MSVARPEKTSLASRKQAKFLVIVSQTALLKLHLAQIKLEGAD